MPTLWSLAPLIIRLEKKQQDFFQKKFLFFKVARNCRLTQVGKMFWPRSYGLALAPGDGGGVDGGGVCGA